LKNRDEIKELKGFCVWQTGKGAPTEGKNKKKRKISRGVPEKGGNKKK